MKHLEILDSTKVKLQGVRSSPETPRGSQSNLRAPREIMKFVESGPICSKTAHLTISMEPRGPYACGLLPLISGSG